MAYGPAPYVKRILASTPNWVAEAAVTVFPQLILLFRFSLLLTLLCLVFDDDMNFPRNRAELYKDALDALLKKWDTSRNILRGDIYKNLSTLRKKQLFSQKNRLKNALLSDFFLKSARWRGNL